MKSKDIYVNKKKIYKVLKERRPFLEMSVQDLIKKTGISATSIYEYERGLTIPNGINLIKLCIALNLDIDDFLS